MGLFKRKREPDLPPGAMIVGLGNPGAEYKGTRHNVGFELVERVARAHGVSLSHHRHQTQYGVGEVAGSVVVLAKPLTYMNLSGKAVAALARQYGLAPRSVLVVADEMDLPLGRLRLKPGGGSAGHNGHRSVIQALGSQDYPRLRIGIGKGEQGVSHVLSRFSPDERLVLEGVLLRSAEACALWLAEGLDKAMNFANADPA